MIYTTAEEAYLETVRDGKPHRDVYRVRDDSGIILGYTPSIDEAWGVVVPPGSWRWVDTVTVGVPA